MRPRIARAMARFHVGAAGAVLLLSLAPGAASAAPGDLDPTFSRDGFATNGRAPSVIDLAIQPGGRMVTISECLCGEFLLTRFEADGTLDDSFGVRGHALSRFEPEASPRAVDLDPAGRIVVAGVALPNQGPNEVAIARFRPDGSLDPSFGEGGQITDDSTGTELAHPTDVLVQPDGKIVVALFGLALRYDANGDRDPSFSGDGIVEYPEGFAASGELLLQPDGKVVVAGGEYPAGGSLFRMTPDGSSDSSFNDDGISEPSPFRGSFGTSLGGLALQPDGAMVVGGTGREFKGLFGFVVRYRSDGSVDGPFATNVATNALPRTVSDVAVQSDGAILVAGTDRGMKWDLFFGRLVASGHADRDFGTQGSRHQDFETRDDHGGENPFLGIASAGAVAIMPDGTTGVVGGSATVTPGRLWPPPNPNTTFRATTDLALIRFELLSGPSDADGDGILDRRDRCDQEFGKRRSGCPVHRRRLTLRYSRARDAFLGELRSDYVACAEGAGAHNLRHLEVTLFEKREGPDRRARTTEAESGEYAIRFSPSPGRYYAHIDAVRHPEIGTCAAARSATVNLP
jgi:uncharacterized delta-60 repeat protein